MRKSNTREFTLALKKQGGWKKTYDSRSGGIRVMLFFKDIGVGRLLEVQLFGDGKHRVRFFLNGRHNTLPTDFETVDQMFAAIELESVKPQPSLK